MRNSVLERHWESTDGQYEIVEIVFLRSNVNNMMTELNGRWSGHFSVNKTLDMVWQRYYCLQVRIGASNVTPVQPVMATEPGLGPNATV
jgi:hypothetical protein